MGYKLHTPHPTGAIWAEISGDTSLQDFSHFVDTLTDTLNKNSRRVPVVIDATRLSPTYLNRLSSRNIQSFTNHPSLKCILVVAHNKVVRLMMTVLFNTTDGFRLFNNVQEANDWLQRNRVSV